LNAEPNQFILQQLTCFVDSRFADILKELKKAVAAERETDASFPSSDLESENTKKELSTSSVSVLKREEADAHPMQERVVEFFYQLLEESEIVRRFVVPCFPENLDVEKVLLTRYVELMTETSSLLIRASSLFSTKGAVRLIRFYVDHRDTFLANDSREFVDFLSEDVRIRLANQYKIHMGRHLRDRTKALVAEDLKVDPTTHVYESVCRYEQAEGCLPYLGTPLPEKLFATVDQLLQDASVVSRSVTLAEMAAVVATVIREYQAKMTEVLLKRHGLSTNNNDKPQRSGGVLAKEGSFRRHFAHLSSPRQPKIQREKSWMTSTSDAADAHIQAGLNYVCATANNASRSLRLSEELKESLFELLDESYHSRLDSMQSVVDGFVTLERTAVGILRDFLKFDLDSQLEGLFTPGTGTEVVLDAVVMLEDSFTELSKDLLPHHFRDLSYFSLKLIVSSYAAKFLEKRVASLKPEPTIVQMEKDIEELRRFFLQYVKKRAFESNLLPIVRIREFYVCVPTASELRKSYEALLYVYPEFTPFAGENVLISRGLGREMVRSAVRTFDDLEPTRERLRDANKRRVLARDSTDLQNQSKLSIDVSKTSMNTKALLSSHDNQGIYDQGETTSLRWRTKDSQRFTKPKSFSKP